MNSYSYTTKKIPASPRNKRLTDSILSAASTGGVYVGSAPSYWSLVGDMIVSNYSAASTGDIIAYLEGKQTSILPIASPSNYGLVKYDGVTLKLDDDGRLYVAGGGSSGIDFTVGAGLELTSDKYLNVLFGTTSNTACAGNDARLSDARRNPYSLSWSGYSSGSYDGASVAKIEIPNNTNQLTNGAGFISDANGFISKIYGTGHANQYLAGDGRFYTIAYSELSGTPDLSVFVTLNTDQTITGLKTFEQNILSKQDIIAYSDSSKLPTLPIASASSYGLVKIDGVTLQYDGNGRLYVAGGGSGGGISSVIPSGSGNAVTGLIYDGSSKSLTYQLGNSFLPLSGGTMSNTNLVGNLNSDMLDGYHESAFLRYRGQTSTDQESTLWNSLGIKKYSNALPDGLTGVYNYGEVISLPGSSARFDMYVAHTTTNTDVEHGIWVRSGWVDDKKPWRRLAFISDTVAAANKLSTTRYLWGQPFDGSGNVKGVIKGIPYVSFETYDYEGGSAGYVGRGGTNSNDLSITTYGENSIEFLTNSLERMRITKDGLIGIGTPIPSSELHVIGKPIFHSNKRYGNAGAMHIQNDYAITGWDRAINLYYPNMGKGANATIHIGAIDSEKNGGYIAYHYAGYKSDNNCMKIGLYSDDDILNVTANRRVGINTTTPQEALDVNGNIRAVGYARLTGDVFINSGTSSDNNNAAGKLFFGGSNSTDHGVYLSATKYDTYGRKRFGIFTTNAASETPNWIESFSITPGGSVGINTTTPEHTLDVNGSSIFRNHIFIKKYHHIFMNPGEEGVYYTDDGLYWHNANNEYVRHLIKFDSAGAVNVCGTVNVNYNGITILKLNQYEATFNGSVVSLNCNFTGAWNSRERFRLIRDGEYNTWLQAATDTSNEGGRLCMSGYNATTLSEFKVYASNVTCTGNILANGDVTAYSDIRLKNRMESVNNVLDTIDTLDVFKYTWKNREDKLVHIGVSAQQVQTIYPEFVLTSSSEDGTDYLTVNYAALATCIAIQGIKELAKKGDERDKKIVSLEKEINNLKERIKTLEAWS